MSNASIPILDLPDARLEYIPDFLSPNEASRFFNGLVDEIPWQEGTVRLFGKEHPIPRLQAWIGDADARYRYSGVDLEPSPWTPLLLEIAEKLSTVRPAVSFNSVLANLYRDGNDSMGWHSDDEPELGDEPTIASISLGATRDFRMRHLRRDDVEPLTLTLEGGSLLLMEGTTQEKWQHSLPKRRGRNSPGPRINLTFRRIFA